MASTNVVVLPVPGGPWTIACLLYTSLEPACWIAIRKADRVILAGDYCQLPPTIKCMEAARGDVYKRQVLYIEYYERPYLTEKSKISSWNMYVVLLCSETYLTFSTKISDFSLQQYLSLIHISPIYKEDRFSDNLFPIVSSLEIVYFVISLTSVTASSQPSIILSLIHILPYWKGSAT